jgi:hypothetical protein
MIKVSVCYSNKSGQEFASCGLSDIELDHALLDDPTALRDRVAAAYQVCEDMVHAQLGTASVAGSVALAGPLPPPTRRPVPPPPAPALPLDTRHKDGTAGSQPTTGKQLWGWIQDHKDQYPDAMAWMLRTAKASRWPAKITDWSPEEVGAAWDTYGNQIEADRLGGRVPNGRH